MFIMVIFWAVSPSPKAFSIIISLVLLTVVVFVVEALIMV